MASDETADLRVKKEPDQAGAQRAAVKRAANPLEDVFDGVWRFFVSVRVALVIILLLAGATLAGTLLIQAPGGVAPRTPEYSDWLQRVRPRYGGWTDVLDTLQLFTIFTSWWFRGLIGLLVISTVVCSVNRWPGISRAVFSPPRVRVGDRFFQQAPLNASFSASGSRTGIARRCGGILAAHHYRVVAEESADAVHLYADKNRYARLGTYLTHLSLVLILVGALLSSLLGFSNKQFVVPEGSTRAVGFGTGLSVKVVSFVDEYYPQGPPKDYRSDLILYQNGVAVKRQTIHVNDPMEFNGVRFYQSFFGPAAYVKVADDAGNTLFNDGVPLAWRVDGDRPAGSFSLPGRDLTVYVVGPASGQNDPSIPAGSMHLEVYEGSSNRPRALENVPQGENRTLAGLQFTFLRERQFTGLEVSSDPGAPVIWLASALLVLGLIATFYFPHRRIWAVVRSTPGGRTSVSLAATARRDVGFGDEFQKLTAELSAAMTDAAGREEAVHV